MNKSDDEELRSLLKTQAPYFEAPAGLRERIGASLETAATPINVKTKSWKPWQGAWGLGLGIALGILLSVFVVVLNGGARQSDYVLSQVVDGHVRSLMGEHLADVTSSDRHTVKPWFSGKLDFSPPVNDFAAQGFPLVGGRLDYINERPVAALVYQHRLHTINVFIWPAKSSDTKTLATATQKGINVAAWQTKGMQFWAVSDLGAGDLEKLGKIIRESEK